MVDLDFVMFKMQFIEVVEFFFFLLEICWFIDINERDFF